jgi:hypothetical protein
MTLPHILDLGYLPALLQNHPVAVGPYLVSRDNFIAREQRQLLDPFGFLAYAELAGGVELSQVG